MSRPQGGRIQVPDDLREILLEFTISYLLEQPGDVINYAVEFFTRLQNNRTTTIVKGPTAGTPDESIISDEEGILNLYSCDVRFGVVGMWTKVGVSTGHGETQVLEISLHLDG